MWNVLDWTLFATFVVSAAVGLYTGFLGRVLMWGGAIGGFIVAQYTYPSTVDQITDWVGERLAFTGVVIFFSICIVVGIIIGKILGIFVKLAIPGVLKLYDRLLGLVFSTILTGALVWFSLPALEITGGTGLEWYQESAFAEFFQNFSDPLNDGIRERILDARGALDILAEANLLEEVLDNPSRTEDLIEQAVEATRPTPETIIIDVPEGTQLPPGATTTSIPRN